ncbi:outer membrane beta-barrel protein [Chitinophaga sp. Ak27]|uniref:outer membrane beta-barrel protein n=1 Tax=Chitinophaga sp. Ak27 TaxID=2726116 RepID=UPI00145F5276|nr:outer membrane beta-barrel protein [Chitinophaga sp. Ak27]NLU93309.1 outer membrane beta-barrel protein [Chitinophaga sp. Ak27]
MVRILPLILLVSLLLPEVAGAQQSLHTYVHDVANNQPLAGATGSLRIPGDTAVISSGMANGQGKISFINIPNGKYELLIHSLGYQDQKRRVTVPGIWPDSIALTPGLTLREVTIQEDAAPVRMKGDTVEYNAAKFKTKENAVVEDLLRKLPGVKVERDGSIKAQGEQVQRILVDGKEFFGSDPTVATRNLPADMIDKVQVLDKQSETGEFTGVADGQQTKTINLVTKKNRKRGFFGNASAGIGTDGRYEGGINANSFAGDMQLSGLLKGNNVNKSGFSASELLQLVMKDPNMLRNLPPAALSELSRMKGVRIEGNGGNIAEIARPTGLTDTKFGGVNFNNDWDNLKWRSSYFYNNNRTSNNYSYARQYRMPDTAYNYLQAGNTSGNNTNQRIDMSGDIKFNPRTSLKISPHMSINGGNNQEDRSYRSFTADGVKLLNDGRQLTNSINKQQLLTTELILRHRLAKPGRTVVLNVTPEYYHNTGETYNRNTGNFYNLQGGEKQPITDQLRTDKGDVYSVNTNILYTEPLSRSLSLQAGQMFYYSQGKYNRQVCDRDASGHYTQPNALLSDIYDANSRQYTSKLSLAGNHKRLLYTVGAGWRQFNIRGSSDMKGYHVNSNYRAWLPEVYAEWKQNKTTKLIFRYNMDASAPSVAQLQPLEDNSDPLYIRKGNPLLQQKKSQHLQLSFNNFQLTAGNSIYARADFTYFNRDITDSTSIEAASGKQYIIPVNVAGNLNGSLAVGKSIGIGHNGSSFTAGISATYVRSLTFTNSLPNINRTWSITPDMNFNYYLGDNINVSARGSAAWNMRRFSVTPLLPEKNWLLMYGVESIVTLPWDISLEAGTDGFSSLGMAAGYNNTILLVNAAITKGIGKSFSLRAEAKDLLNRNITINRINGSGYIEDRQNSVLGRYFLLSAVYKFRHFPKTKK